MSVASSHDVAKAFGRFQDEALSEEPVVVTRYGRPTVVILSYAEYERLRRGAAGQGPRRQVFRAADLPADLVAELERTQPPPEASAFDHELDDDQAR